LADPAPNVNTGALKRRSTRIVQAVPLTVTGVDALGRPFEERTSTSIINCHGCRYQSKHYVLKNMWVTFEVPHPEQGRPPRTVRGRVMWIQRPRTVRELFQVGVELEVPGNLWGIAFCPPDWFPFPDSESEMLAPSLEAPHEEAVPEPVEAAAGEAPKAAEKWSGSPEELPAEDNLRTMPMPGPVAGGAEQLSQQMERLVNEAQQQLRAEVRDRAAEAIAAEAQPLLASLQTQLQDAAERSAQVAAAAASEQAIRSAVASVEAMADARLRELVDRFNEELSRGLDQYQQKLEIRSGEIASERREALEQQFQSQVEQRLNELATAAADSRTTLEGARENLEALRRQAEDSISSALRDGALRLQAQADDARTRVSEVETILQHSIEQIAPVATSAQAQWKTHLEAEMAVAAKRWDEQVQGSLQNASQKIEDRLAGTAQAASERLEKELSERIAGISKAFLEATAGAEGRLATARASLEDQVARVQALLTQVQSAARPAAVQTTELDAVHGAAQQELERRAAALVEIQSQELARRAESSIATWTQRLQPSLEAAAQETVARLGAQFEQHLGSHIDRAHQVMGRLEFESVAAGEALLKREEALAAISNRIVEAATVQLHRQIETLEHDFQEAGRRAAAQWLSEIDSKATETTHTTFESLFKTAEWYEKKVQAHMHTALEKGVEQGVEQLREKAGEISRLFASELDHYSRNYVEHTQGQLEEAGHRALEHARNQSAEMTSAAISALTQQMQSGTDAATRDFSAKTGAVLDKLAAQVEEQAAQTRATIEVAAQRLSIDFDANIKQQAQQALGSAKLELASQVNAACDSLRAESDAREKHLREALASASDQGIETYKQRLESAANSWLLTTASKLNQDSQQQLATLASAAETRLRDTCKQVFANVGEALRQQMLDLPLSQPPKDSGNEKT